MRGLSLCFICLLVFPVVVKAQIPVFEITPVESTISFDVEASVAIKGVFHNWDSKFTCTSTNSSQCVLEIKIQADSVDTGSGMTDGQVKSKDLFNVKENPYITFKSTHIVEPGPDTSEVDGDFTIRGVTKSEKLKLLIVGKGTGSGTVTGTMAFDRKDYGMNSGIPLVKIANRVEVTVNLKVKRVSGPPLVFSQ